MAAPIPRFIYMMLGANMLFILVLAWVTWFKTEKVINFNVSEASPSVKVRPSDNVESKVTAPVPISNQNPKTGVSDSGSDALAEAMKKTVLTPEEQKLIGQGVSLKTADDLFVAGRYLEACYVYRQIGLNWTSSGTHGEYLKDYLKLRMAICLHRAGQTHAQEECFTQALQSRTAYVRGMACYYLARIHFQNQEYLEARQKAYQAIALWKAFEDMLSTNLEADMYFLIADSLTREVVGLYNIERQLPGRDWSDSLTDIWPAQTDALKLEEALSQTAEKIGQGAGNPRLTVDTNRPVGSQWSLICLQSPLEETLWNVVSQANMKAVWEGDSRSLCDRPATAYMIYIPQQYAAETLCGSIGLIWRFDGQNASILNPVSYTDFELHRGQLIEETISIWQRFLQRHRDDSRIPNVHYALGRMYAFAGQSAAALGEFKLLEGRFAQNALAPYAYLEASKIKVDMKDYEGADVDLSEMLLQYPDCPIIDEATLYLAQMTFASGQTEKAKALFRKSFQMNLSKGGKCEATVGLGRCVYVQQDWNETQIWLNRAMELMEDKKDSRIGDICFMLGRAYLNLGQYAKAAEVLQTSLNSRLSEKEYIQTVLELVEAESRQQNFLEAMNILENVPQSRLSQEDSCNLLIAKSGVLREIGLAGSAISLLHKKIEFIADSRLRARLTLELAVCYLATQEYSEARRELNNVLSDMPDSHHVRRANLILAQIIEKSGQPLQAKDLCMAILADPQAEDEVRNDAFNILGRIYAGQKHYEKAALAFAGILPQGVSNP